MLVVQVEDAHILFILVSSHLNTVLSHTMSPSPLWDLVTAWILLWFPFSITFTQGLCLPQCLPLLLEILSRHAFGFDNHFVFLVGLPLLCEILSRHGSSFVSPFVSRYVSHSSLPLCVPCWLGLCFPLLFEIMSRHGSGLAYRFGLSPSALGRSQTECKGDFAFTYAVSGWCWCNSVKWILYVSLFWRNLHGLRIKICRMHLLRHM